MRFEYPDQIDVEVSGLNHLSYWKGLRERSKRCPIEDSSTRDFEYDSEMKWDYSDYQI